MTPGEKWRLEQPDHRRVSGKEWLMLHTSLIMKCCWRTSTNLLPGFVQSLLHWTPNVRNWWWLQPESCTRCTVPIHPRFSLCLTRWMPGYPSQFAHPWVCTCNPLRNYLAPDTEVYSIWNSQSVGSWRCKSNLLARLLPLNDQESKITKSKKKTFIHSHQVQMKYGKFYFSNSKKRWGKLVWIFWNTFHSC